MKIKLPLMAFGLSAMFALGAVVSPIYAIDSTDAMTEDEKAEYIAEYKKEAAEKKEQYRLEAEKKAAELKAQALKKSQELKNEANEQKKEAYEKRLEQRKQFCEKNEEALQKRIQTKSEVANKYQEKFDGFYSKIDRFIEDKQLDVENYNELTTAVLAAKDKVGVAVGSIKQLNIDVDCGDVDLTSQEMTAYRNSVNEAKASLKEYRGALVDLLVAVKTSYNNAEKVESGEGA